MIIGALDTCTLGYIQMINPKQGHKPDLINRQNSQAKSTQAPSEHSPRMISMAFGTGTATASELYLYI